MKQFKYILLIILSFCFNICYGQMDNNEQQIIPQSPTVASLVQHVDCPVSYYSGTPSINIPLYEINVDNVTIPLSLSYHASGIKVSQESSWVGLCWSLQAGGCISRSVQCYDDFNEYYYPSISVKEGYFESGDIVDPHADEYYTHIFPYLQLTTDSEPDIFYYSFPGHSGKFILDKSRGAVLFDKSDGVKVFVEEEYNRKYFRLIAKDGTQYIFNIISVH